MRWAGLIGCCQARPCARIERRSAMRKGAVAITVAVSGCHRPVRAGEAGSVTWVGVRGLEPRTSSLSGKRSNRLSYTPSWRTPPG
jgi:hypothetical protein